MADETIARSIIRISGLKKHFGQHEILKDITINITEGEILGVIGGSGAGKTTFFRTLVGFYGADAGEIWLNGRNIREDPIIIRTIMGFASQEGCFYEELTCVENLAYFGRLYDLDSQKIQDKTNELLNLVELESARNTLAKNLSGGMKKRLDLAIALLHEPKILIMDEPTTGLDAKLRKSMLALVKRVNKLGTTVIISSHIMEDMEHLCDRVCLLFSGNLIVAASPAQLKEQYSRNEEIYLESYPGNYSEIVAELLRRRLPISMHSLQEHKLVLYTAQAEIVLRHLLEILMAQNEKLLDLDVNRPSLNEVFEAFSAVYGQKK